MLLIRGPTGCSNNGSLPARPGASANEAEFVGLQVKPIELVLNPKAEQALSVTARYSDGSTRDVTAMAEYFSQKPNLLQVSDTGVVKTLDGRGEGVVMVRYQGAVASARVLVPFRRDLPESAYAGFQPRELHR